MKKLIIVLLLCLPKWLPAQELFLIEDTITTRNHPVNALVTNVKSEYDEAIDNYKSYVKSEYDLKVKKENNTTYFIQEVDLPHLSIKRGDLKTHLLHADTANIMAFSFQLGYDIFLSSKDHPQEMNEFRRFVINYLEYHFKTYYDHKLDETSKELGKEKKMLQQSEDKIHGMKKKALTIEKRLAKEKDEAKKIELNSNKQLLEQEIEQLVKLLPEQRDHVNSKEFMISELKAEYQKAYQSVSNLKNTTSTMN